jgi:hypothetical protein
MLTLWLIPLCNRDLAIRLRDDSRRVGRNVSPAGVYLCAASPLFLVPSIFLAFDVESAYALLIPIAVGLCGFTMLAGWRLQWLWVPILIPVLVAIGFVVDILIAAVVAAVLTPAGAGLAHLCFLGLGVHCIFGPGRRGDRPDAGVSSAGTLRSFDLPEGHP